MDGMGYVAAKSHLSWMPQLSMITCRHMGRVRHNQSHYHTYIYYTFDTLYIYTHIYESHYHTQVLRPRLQPRKYAFPKPIHEGRGTERSLREHK